MRRILVLAAALGIMWFLGQFTGDVPVEGPHPLTLAAIGFVLLGAFTIGELGERLGLPKVTGYIVSGVLLGPQLADILSTTVAGELQVFNTLALGLIATTAGLELDLKAIGRVWKSLTAYVVLKIPLLLMLVGGAFVVIERMAPSLDLAPEAILPLGLILAVLGIGTSPAIALAVVNEGKAKGRLTDILLAIAVVKDLVVVVSLAVALAIAKTMLYPGGSLDAHVLMHVGQELGSSVLAGAVLGGLLIAYVRFVHRQMLLFVLITILVASELSATLHLELLLVFIVAGFLVRNFSPYEHELMHPLERIALPVFVVFFTTAGANIDLKGTIGLLPLATALVLARALAFYIAGRAGSSIGGEPDRVRDNGWLTWLPQAGVTLGLVLLAAESLPELAVPLTSIGMALVAINLLIGPVTLGMGLRRAGEMGGGGDVDADAPAPDVAKAGKASADDEAAVPLASPEELAAQLPASVGTMVLGLRNELLATIEGFVQTRAADSTEALCGSAIARLVDRVDSPDGAANVVLGSEPIEHVDFEVDAVRLFESLAGHIQALPESLALDPIEAPAEHLIRDNEGALPDKLRRALRRRTHAKIRRNPPLRMMGRQQLEGRMSEVVLGLCNAWYRHHARLLELLRDAVEGKLATTHCQTQLDGATARWLEVEHAALNRAVEEGIAALFRNLIEAASPLGDPRPPRFSQVEPTVLQNLADIHGEAGRRRAAVEATYEHLRAAVLVADVEKQVHDTFESWGLEPLAAVDAQVLAEIRAIIAELQALSDQLQSDPGERLKPDWWQPRLTSIYPIARRLQMRRNCLDFRSSTMPNELLHALTPLVENAPERLRSVTGTPVSQLASPSLFEATELRAAARLRVHLLDEMLPAAARVMSDLAPRLIGVHALVAEGLEVAGYGLTTAARSDGDGPGIQAAMDRALQRLQAELNNLETALDKARRQLEASEQQLHRSLQGLLVSVSGVTRVQNRLAAALRSMRGAAQLVGRGLGRGKDHLVLRWSVLLQHRWFVERAVRAGHERVDAEQIRAALRIADPQPSVPASVHDLFDNRPLDDRRMFAFHREHVGRLSQHLNSPNPTTPLLALVVGARGSGRTSLLNMLQLRARNLRILRPDSTFYARSGGPLAALASELHCAPDVVAIEAALSSERSLVLLDNVERFVMPTVAGIDKLDKLVGLAAASARRGSQWIVTIEAEALARLDEVLTFGGLFNQRIELRPCSWQDLRDVMQARFRLSGLSLEHVAVDRFSAVLGGPEDQYYRLLERRSGGNISAALHLHRGALEAISETRLRLGRPADIRLPFLAQLSEPALASLGLVYQYGPMTSVELADALGSSVDALARHLQFLLAGQLLVSDPIGRDLLSLGSGLALPLSRELVRQRILPGETP